MSVRSAAGQVFALQAVIVVVVVAAAVLVLVLQARHDSRRDARNRSLATAESFADAPGTAEALASRDPTAALQPHVREARQGSGMDFVSVMERDGTRVADTDPSLIGERAQDIGRAAAGEPFTEIFRGDPNNAARAVVPVIGADGTVVGLVGAGIGIGSVAETVNSRLPVLFGAAAGALVLATGGSALVSRRLRRQTHGLGPAEMTRMYEHHDAVLHAVREGVLIIGADRRVQLANDEARRLLGLPADAERRSVTELGLDPHIAELLASGRIATDEVHLAGDRLLAVNVRATSSYGGFPGSVATLRDTTELAALTGKVQVAQERLKQLYDAGVRIGTTLDVARTAEELAEAATGYFADFTTVDLADPVLRGEEPVATEAVLRRTAVSGIRKDHPLFPLGELVPFARSASHTQTLNQGRAVLESDLNEASAWQEQDPEVLRRFSDHGIHSRITVPLRARGTVLGLANFWRSEEHGPFDDDDVDFAEELVALAAVCIDNARRYTREHSMAVTLQRNLLPRVLPEQSALDVAYRYLPAQAGVGGDWFDVIPLPGARVALVVGDVVGHGLHAAATMGRLRTAVHNFSTLDLPPEELLGRLDDLVCRIDQDELACDGDGISGATCMYAIYDPSSGSCTVARAGHPGPALVRPDGSVEFPQVPAGLPLGLGGMPFESAELRLPEGSRLVLFTDGLVEDRDRDIDTGLDLLRGALARSGRSPEETCADVLDAVLSPRPSDDVVLLVARTRRVGAEQIAVWDVPSDPAAVRRVRAEASSQLAAWGLDDIAFTTELILSELVTNAIRYGIEPIRVRFLYDRHLVCEVSDGSSTSPHLRYAATTDEGGRGLFLVAQFAERWGTRYTRRGKIIWAEQSPTGGAPEATMQVPGLDDLDW